MALKINVFNVQELFLSSIWFYISVLSNCNLYLILSPFNDILEMSLVLILNPESATVSKVMSCSVNYRILKLKVQCYKFSS